MLKLVNRKGVWYLRGTVALGTDSQRVYESTRLRVRDTGSKKAAQEYLETRQTEIRQTLQHGPESQVTFAIAAHRYIQRRRARLIEDNPRFDPEAPDPTAELAAEIADYLAGRGRGAVPLRGLTADEITGFFRTRHLDRGNKLITARRHAAVYIAIMNMAVQEGWADTGFPRPDLGNYDRQIKPVVGKYFEAPEIAWMLANAPTHFHPVLALGLATGRRTSDLAWLARPGRYDETRHSGELRMQQGQEHIYLGRTKNGKAKVTYLPAWLLPILHGYLARRQDRHPELFLTDRGLPYSRPRKQHGGVFKKVFGTLMRNLTRHLLLDARTRPIGSPERRHLISRARTVRHATPHWFRHNAASHIYLNGGSDADAMDHVGWQDTKMAARYRHMMPERGKDIANRLDFGIGAAVEDGAKPVQSIKTVQK